MSMNSAGGHFVFGPTLNSTQYVRAGIEGPINGFYDINVAKAESVNGETAGRFGAMSSDGSIVFAGDKGAGAIGLIRDDLKDMQNASGKASLYFGYGEYHVAESRLGVTIDQFTLGGNITTNANGQIVPAKPGDNVVGTVISIGEYTMGNMYQWAGDAANGGKFLGFFLK